MCYSPLYMLFTFLCIHHFIIHFPDNWRVFLAQRRWQKIIVFWIKNQIEEESIRRSACRFVDRAKEMMASLQKRDFEQILENFTGHCIRQTEL
jgi:hypothetical protein